MDIEFDDQNNPFLPGHREASFDLCTPRQYTARGGWNMNCECGTTFAESGDADVHERWLQHLTAVSESAVI